MDELLSYLKSLNLDEDGEGGRALPPVERWNPSKVGEIDIRIDREGHWHHEGGPIRRARLVRLFASILLRDGEDHFLVTPIEKLKIQVDDAPFLAVLMELDAPGREQTIRFTTNLGDKIALSANHSLRLGDGDDAEGAQVPYIHVRRGLEARVNRSCYFDLINIAEPGENESADGIGVYSDGKFFSLVSE